MVKFLDTENDKVEEDGGISMLPETFSTLLHALSSNYITSSLAPSTGVFLGEKLNGQNYFSWSQSVKMFLEGRHQFSVIDKEDSLVPTR